MNNNNSYIKHTLPKKKRNIQQCFPNMNFLKYLRDWDMKTMIMLKFKCPIIEFKLLIVALDNTWPIRVTMCNAARGRRIGISRAVAHTNHFLSLSGFNEYARQLTVWFYSSVKLFLYPATKCQDWTQLPGTSSLVFSLPVNYTMRLIDFIIFSGARFPDSCNGTSNPIQQLTVIVLADLWSHQQPNIATSGYFIWETRPWRQEKQHKISAQTVRNSLRENG